MSKVLARFLTVSLMATPAFADTEAQKEPVANQQKRTTLYVGVDVLRGDSDFDVTVSGDLVGKTTVNSDLDGFRLKFGAKLQNNWRLQGFFKSEDSDFFDNNIYGIGIDVIKAFEVTEKFYPFIQAGVSSDWTELDVVPGAVFSEDNLSAISLKVGAGAIYQLADNVEILGGIDFQYRQWQDIELYDYFTRINVEQDDTADVLYLGLNVSF